MLNRTQKRALLLHQASLMLCLSVYLFGGNSWRQHSWVPLVLAVVMFCVLISMLLVFSRAGVLKKRFVVLFAAVLIGAPAILVLLASRA